MENGCSLNKSKTADLRDFQFSSFGLLVSLKIVVLNTNVFYYVLVFSPTCYAFLYALDKIVMFCFNKRGLHYQ